MNNNKVYCKECRFHIPYIAELDGYQPKQKADPDDGRDICSSGLNVQKNWNGDDRIELYNKRDVCDQCGTTLNDNGEIRYTKCETKNRKKNCAEFKPQTWQSKYVARMSQVSDRISAMLSVIRGKRLPIFAIWAMMHCITITQLQMDLFGKIYIGMSLLFFTLYLVDRS